MWLRISALLFAALFGCGGLPSAPASSGAVQSQSLPIIKGENCDEQTNPEAIAILNVLDYVYQGHPYHQVALECSGTLIAPDVVLTAGHCASEPEIRAMSEFYGMPLDKLEFYVTRVADLQHWANDFTSELPEDAVRVTAAALHPDFNDEASNPAGGPQHFNDIAVLFLDTPQAGQPAVVITPEERAQLAVGAPVSIVGWGMRSPTIQIGGLKQCGQTTINELGDTEMQIGSDALSTRKCHGDSGGPSFMDVETSAAVKRRIVGVTSHGYDESDCKKGGLDTRVDAYYAWLNETLTKACVDGTRVWCDVPGVIPPSFYDPPPVNAGSGGETAHPGGCASTPASLLAFLPLLAARRRRANVRRGTGPISA